MVDNGIKPVYVFDGKPPEMKSGEVSRSAIWLQRFCSDNNCVLTIFHKLLKQYVIMQFVVGKKERKTRGS